MKRSMWLSLLNLVTVSATTLRVTIPPSANLPNPGVILSANTHATLTTAGKRLTAPIRASQADFLFDVPSPPAGNADAAAAEEKDAGYILTIDSKEFIFRSYRVDFTSGERSSGSGKISASELTRGTPWDRTGADAKWRTGDAGDADVILEVAILGRRGYYDQRATFSPLSLFKNPMILLAVAALGLTFGMPKLMENMDPEMREEFEKQSRSGPISGSARNAMQGGGFDLAGWMAGTNQPGQGQAGPGQEQARIQGQGQSQGSAGASGSAAGSGSAKRRRG